MSNGRFCSKEHAQEYVQQQTQMAVDVLHRTHDALQAYKPKGSSVEDILGINLEEQAASPVLTEDAPFVLPPPIVAPPPAMDSAWSKPPAAPAPPSAFHVGESAKKLGARTEAPWWRRLLASVWPLQPAHRN